MKTINGAAFRKQQATHMNECEISGEPLLVVTAKKGGVPFQQMIVISKAEYDRMQNIINGVK